MRIGQELSQRTAGSKAGAGLCERDSGRPAHEGSDTRVRAFGAATLWSDPVMNKSEPALNTAEYLPANNLFILISILLIAIAGFAWFMRKRSNRHPMDTPRGREIEEERTREVLEAREHTIETPPTRQ